MSSNVNTLITINANTISSGTSTLCYSYVAAATTVKERTTAFSIFNLALASAFVLGPGYYFQNLTPGNWTKVDNSDLNSIWTTVIQAAFVPLGEDGIDMGSNLSFNVYTGPSWLSAGLALGNMFLFSPFIFKEFNIAKKEGEIRKDRSMKNNPGEIHP